MILEKFYWRTSAFNKLNKLVVVFFAIILIYNFLKVLERLALDINDAQELRIQVMIDDSELISINMSYYSPDKTNRCNYATGSSIRKGPRILCAVYTHENTSRSIQDVANTWGHKCDRTIYILSLIHI